MTGFPWLNTPILFVEIGQDWLRALYGDAGRELALDRAEDGRLTGPCRERVTRGLRDLLKRKSWQPRVRAFCALGARGVSVRRLTLPSAAPEELQKVLSLQIESEFPLPPDELAWGHCELEATDAARTVTSASRQVMVAAVKRDAVEEYAELLAACDISPTFTVAALNRRAICPAATGPCAVLDIGPRYSELALFDAGTPVAVRVIPWGEPAMTGAAGTGRENGSEAALKRLAQGLNGAGVARTIYLTGASSDLKQMAAGLAQRLETGARVEPIFVESGEGRSAAIFGLKKAVEEDVGGPPLVLQLKTANGAASAPRPTPLKWAAAAAALALAALLLPYAEAVVLKPFLTRKLQALRSDQGALATIDHEFDFLHYVKQSQSPYLDTLYLLARSAPAGARFTTVSMSRRGDLSLRGTMQNGQQVVDFRSKLVDSGFFSTVVVEEQSPTPDRQKVNVRISAQWKNADARKPLPAEPPSKPGERSGPLARGGPPGPTVTSPENAASALPSAMPSTEMSATPPRASGAPAPDRGTSRGGRE